MFLATASLSVSGSCSSAPPAAGIQAQVLDTHALYAAISVESPTAREARLGALSSVSVRSYYQQLASAAIDGYEWQLQGATYIESWGSASAFHSKIDTLTEAFGTMGALWRAVGFDPKTTLSETEFSSAVIASFKGSSERGAELELATPSLSDQLMTAFTPPSDTTVYMPPDVCLSFDPAAPNNIDASVMMIDGEATKLSAYLAVIPENHDLPFNRHVAGLNALLAGKNRYRSGDVRPNVLITKTDAGDLNVNVYGKGEGDARPVQKVNISGLQVPDPLRCHKATVTISTEAG